jgi:hypothetical protein
LASFLEPRGGILHHRREVELQAAEDALKDVDNE